MVSTNVLCSFVLKKICINNAKQPKIGFFEFLREVRVVTENVGKYS